MGCFAQVHRHLADETDSSNEQETQESKCQDDRNEVVDGIDSFCIKQRALIPTTIDSRTSERREDADQRRANRSPVCIRKRSSNTAIIPFCQLWHTFAQAAAKGEFNF